MIVMVAEGRLVALLKVEVGVWKVQEEAGIVVSMLMGIILVALVLLEGVGAIRGGSRGGSMWKREVDGHAWYF